MKKCSVLTVAIFCVAFVVAGCMPSQTIIDIGDDPEKSGEILIFGSLMTSIEEARTVEKELKKNGDTSILTPSQWSEIINVKASQVSSVEIKLTRENDGVIVYYGNNPVVGGSFNILIRGIEAGTYIVTLGFKGNGLDEWLFSSIDKVDVVPLTTTNATIVVYLNNYCQKQIRVVGLDSIVAQTTTPVITVGHPEGGSFTIIGEGYWFMDEPDVMDIVFRDNLPFDIVQPVVLGFMTEHGNQIASMLLEFNPVEIAGWELTLPFVAFGPGDLNLTIYVSPPM